MNPPVQRLSLLVRGRGHFGQNVGRGLIVDRMHRVPPQRIDVELGDPKQDIVDEELPDCVTVAAVEVERLTPPDSIALGKVCPEVAQMVSFRAEVVVNHIYYNSQAATVTGIDEPL